MVCLDVDHPDIEQFVNWKVKEEQKVAALVAGSKHQILINELFQAATPGLRFLNALTSGKQALA